jgi:hypothetical protein
MGVPAEVILNIVKDDMDEVSCVFLDTLQAGYDDSVGYLH